VSIYDDLGIEPIINASGSVTRLGGAPMPPEVVKAFADAAAEAVPLDQLQAAACRIIAEITGAGKRAWSPRGPPRRSPWAPRRSWRASIAAAWKSCRFARDFPTNSSSHASSRNGYDHAVRAAGARLIEVGFHEIVAGAGVRRAEAWEYEAAFGPNTAGVLYVFTPDSRPSLREVAERAHRRGLPVLVDAAGGVPPRERLRSLIADGADLVAFSGGKAIRGPQATGILCGRRDFIASAAVQMLDMDDHPELWAPPQEFIERGKLTGLPRHGIGRGFKVAKEQIVALLTALRLFATGGYDTIVRGYRPRLERIATALKGTRSVCQILDRGDGETFPQLEIAIDEKALGRNAFDVCRRLRQGKPPIYVGHWRLDQGRLMISPMNVDDAAAEVLARRLREELS